MRTRGRLSVAGLAVAVVGALLLGAAPKAEKGAKAPKGKPAAKADLPEVRLVEITLGGEIAEQVAFTLPFGPSQTLLRDYTGSIRRAAKDPNIRGIILRLRPAAIGLAKVQELGEAFDELKAANKKVYCYTELCSNVDYLLACCADKIVVAPGGTVATVGLAMEVTFLKGLLEWAGIKMDVVARGKHKTAGEPFTQDKMTAENRRVFDEFLDDVYEQFLGLIAKGRGVTPKQAAKLVDGGPYSAAEAKQAGLIDAVRYYDQFLADIGQELGGKVVPVKRYHHLGRKGPDPSQFNILTIFASMRPKADIPATSRPKVVIIYATGPILVDGSPDPFSTTISASSLAKAFKSAREEPTVKAVVLRIDSPGGAAVTSDLIWREVVRTRKAGKPVVASMSGVAASGGYYIAMAADKIVAHPATITGSIGVLGIKPSLAGLYKKIGVSVETFHRGKNAGLLTLTSPLTDSQRKRIESLMDAIYGDFVTKAAQGRNLPRDDMLKLATGRVWTARAAQKHKLVDQLGGLTKAYDIAVELAGIKGRNVQPVILPRKKDFFEMLFSRGADASAWLPLKLARRLPGPWRHLVPSVEVLRALSQQPVLALMPFVIDIR